MSSTTRKGDEIQCEIISSSSDMYNTPLSSKFPIKCRKSYRTCFKQFCSAPRSFEIVPRGPKSLFNLCIDPNSISTRFATASVVLIFALSLSTLYLVYRSFPEVTKEEQQHIRLPWNIEQAKNLGLVLNRYKADHYYQVMSGVFITYIFLQTFAIPGSLFLSILSGYLFPFTLALALVCTCSAVGASLCFLLSQLLGRKIVLTYYPEKAERWAMEVNKHRDNLFNYIFFLRVTPFLPNWFINLTAPVIGVPLLPFALGTFFGVAPPSFIAIQGGQTLHDMTAHDSAFSVTTFIWLLVFGVLSLIPILFKGKLKDKIE